MRTQEQKKYQSGNMNFAEFYAYSLKKDLDKIDKIWNKPISTWKRPLFRDYEAEFKEYKKRRKH